MKIISIFSRYLVMVVIFSVGFGCNLNSPSTVQNRESVNSAVETKKTQVLPRPGLYREKGSGVTRELTAITATSMNFRQWETETPIPPTNKDNFFSSGTAVLLADGLTWRMKNKDVEGYCCGNNVEFEFQVSSPTSLIAKRYRLWALNDPTPGEEDFWQSMGNVEFKFVGEIEKPD